MREHRAAADLSPFFPPVNGRVRGCRHADRDGVFQFGRAPFFRSLIAAPIASLKSAFRSAPKIRFSSRPISKSGAARRFGQDGPKAPAQRRAAVLTKSSTAPGSMGLGVVSAGAWFFPRSAEQSSASSRNMASGRPVLLCPGRGHRGARAAAEKTESPCLVPAGTPVRLARRNQRRLRRASAPGRNRSRDRPARGGA